MELKIDRLDFLQKSQNHVLVLVALSCFKKAYWWAIDKSHTGHCTTMYSLTYLVLHRTIATTYLHMYCYFVKLRCSALWESTCFFNNSSEFVHPSALLYILLPSIYYQPHSLLPKALPRVIFVMEFLDVWLHTAYNQNHYK